MSFASRTLLIALAGLALVAPAALARPADLRSEAPTSSLSGTTEWTLDRSFDPWPVPQSRTDVALATEDAYSTYGEPARTTAAMPAATTGGDDGIAWLPFVLAVSGALVVGLGAGSALHVAHARRRRPATLAT